MGDPRRIKKKYETPSHPWQGPRIEHESELKKTYGVKNKSELYKMESRLKYFKDQAKGLVARGDAQAARERQHMQAVLTRLGLLSPEASMDAVLGLTINQIMDRRLQTLVFKRGLARSVGQARQFIVHRHILVGGAMINSPSFLVPVTAEASIEFAPVSSLFAADHPERQQPVPEPVPVAKKDREVKEPHKKIMTEEELEAAEIAEALGKLKEEPLPEAAAVPIGAVEVPVAKPKEASPKAAKSKDKLKEKARPKAKEAA